MLSESKGHERFKKMLANGKDDNFKWAYEIALEYGHGKPSQTIDMELNDVTKRPRADEVEAAIRAFEHSSNGKSMDQRE